MDIHFFRRKPNKIFFSIEELFDVIEKKVQEKYTVRSFTMPYPSTGIAYRIKNVLFSLKSKGPINHITGDIHYLGIFLPGRNTVLTIHDCGELEKLRGIRRFLLWLFWFYLPVKKAKYITTISESTKKELLKYVKTRADKIYVIPNCLIGEYTFSNKTFDANRPMILQIGTTPNKNIERLAQALRNISCTLVIVGKPSQNQEKALKENNITFSYRQSISREEIIELYYRCDMVAFVSLLEGFGLPIIEAQASGKPVITSNISVLIETAGTGACFVDPYDIEEIKRGVLKIISDSEYRSLLVKNGKSNYKRFLPEIVSEKYGDLYRQISSTNAKER